MKNKYETDFQKAVEKECLKLDKRGAFFHHKAYGLLFGINLDNPNDKEKKQIKKANDYFKMRDVLYSITNRVRGK